MRYKEEFIYKKTFIHIIVLSIIIIFHCMDKQYYPCNSSSFLIISASTAYGAEISTRNEFEPEIIKGIEDEVALLAEELFVTIASRQEEKTVEAPSIVTVITAEEIKNIGARTLFDILQTVPGFDTIKNASFGVNRFGARGMQASDRKIKVLIDGHSLNMPLNGRATTFFDDLPLKNVKKIEIIRGPGSALYGENAFLAVINIITKDAGDIDGIEVASGFGRYDTHEYSILFGKTLHDIDISGYARYHKTNGLSSTIDRDSIFGAPFAITPGKTNDSRINSDLNLKLSYKDIEFNAKYMNKNTEPFVGVQFALTDDSVQRFNYVMGNLRYKLDIWERLTFKPRVYYDQYDTELYEKLFPEGYTIPSDLDGDGDIEIFPSGMIADAFVRNRKLGSEIQVDYAMFDNNTLTLGFDYAWKKQDNVRYITNFNPLTSAALNSLQDQSNTANWIREKVRQIWAVYIQDKWDVTDTLGLTIGIRHDQYSDFEGTTNPRLGLVWNFMNNAHFKLLYGRAFRAPSFEETSIINNPAFLGNPNLDPETISTYEIGLGYKFKEFINTNINYFYSDIDDEIQLTQKGLPNEPLIFENTSGPHIQGIEFELKADLCKTWEGLYAFANYTYLDAESKEGPLPGVPKHKGNVGVNFPIGKYLNANLHTFISDKRVRSRSDSRDDSSGYALVNLTLITGKFFKDMGIKASLFNLLDKDYSDPTPINTIPTDLPKPGRTFFFELSFKH